MASTKGIGSQAPGCSAASANTSTNAGLGRRDVVGVQSSILGRLGPYFLNRVGICAEKASRALQPIRSFGKLDLD
jgi:hypothetical protein